MKRWMVLCVGILCVAGVSGAAVIDNFDVPMAPNPAYTTTMAGAGQQVDNVPGGAGWTALPPVAGNGLGMAGPYLKKTYGMMRSDVTVSPGESADVFVAPASYCGGGLMIEFNDGAVTGYYAVGVADMGGTVSLHVLTHDGQGGDGSPLGYSWGGAEVPGHTAMYRGPKVGQGPNVWYHVTAALSVVGADVVIDAELTDLGGTVLDSTQWIDVGMAPTTTTSNLGLLVSEWSSAGPDFDELGYIGIPEPASLILLGVGGAFALLRRRR